MTHICRQSKGFNKPWRANMLKAFRPAIILSAIAFLFDAEAARAASVTYDFQVAVDPSSNVPGISSVLYGTVTFDDSIADLLPADPNVGVYVQPVGSTMSISSGSFSYSTQL